MNIERLIKSTRKNEGFSKEVYQDSLGIDTIGIGFTLEDLRLSEGVSMVILRIILLERVIELQNRFKWFGNIHTKAQEFVVEMSYQLGISGFAEFKKTIGFLKKHEYYNAGVEAMNSKWAREQTPNRAKRMTDILKSLK